MTTDYQAAALIFDQMGWEKVVDYGLGPSDNVQDAIDGLDGNLKIVDIDGGDLSFFIPDTFKLAREEDGLSVYERTISRCNPRRSMRRWDETQSVYVAKGETKFFIHADL